MALVSACVLGMALPMSAAGSEPGPGGWSISGSITDMAGRPVPGSYAADGSSYAEADNHGDYRLDLDALTLDDYVVAYGRGTAYQPGRVVYRTDDTDHVDFQLKYRLAAGASPWVLADPPAVVHLVAYSYIGSTDCVVAIDPASQERIPLALEATGSYNTWSVDVPVDPAIPTGLHSIDVVGVTCDSGVELTPRYAARYLVDRAAPTVEITSPRTGQLTVNGQDLGPSWDGATRSVGRLRIAVRAADDGALDSVVIELRTPEGDFVSRCYISSVRNVRSVEGSCSFTVRGEVVATAIATDLNEYKVRSAPVRVAAT